MELPTEPLLVSSFIRARTPAKRPPRRERVVVVGLGYVGLPLAILSRVRGHAVFGIDTDADRRASIRSASVKDLGESFLAALRNQPIETAGDFSAVESADIVIVCVPTPVDEERNPDLAPVVGACERIGAHMRKGQLIVLESTVHPGTCEDVAIPLLEEKSGLRAGKDFEVAHCPERINPGDPYWPVQRIPRVIGATTPRALRRAAAFYRSILDALVYEMDSLREAEAVKVVENSFRDVNIAFVNELAMSFAKLGIDVVNVIEGAATKPFAFMPHYPGCGVGGHCIPVDPYYLIRYAKENGFSHEFLSLARKINSDMPAFTVGLLEDEFARAKRVLNGSVVALLGLSYKADVGDLRGSPAFELWHLLSAKGARVRAFDPHAPERSSVKTLESALFGADAAVIATAHARFRSLAPAVFLKNGVGIVIDGRNCLQKEQYAASSLSYRGIGR